MRRNVSKRLILTALICNIIVSSANAATIESIKLNAGKINFIGSSSAEKISYKIYSSSKSGTIISDICEMGEAKVSEGEFSFDIKMPQIMSGAETDGNFIIEVKDSLKTAKNFLFTGYSYRTAFLTALNTKTMGTEIYDLFEGKSLDEKYNNTDIMKNLGADIDYYNALDTAEKNKIASAFLQEKGGTAIDENNFSEVFDHARAVQYINKNDVTDAWLNESSLEFENVKYKYADKELKNWISDILDDGTSYNSYSDIEKKYREANVLYLLDNAKFTDYDALISQYDDAIGIGSETYYAIYKSMSPLNQSNVNTALKNAIALSKPKTKEAFKSAYEKAINDEITAISKSQTSNPSGGSAGGGGGGIPLILPEKTNPTVIVSGFSDIESVEWAKEAITALANAGVVSGYDDNTFKPQQSIKREEFVKMVISAAKIDLNKAACKFDDVEQDKWYAQYVNAAFGAGIISGISETEFGIGKGITREDMAVIIARLINVESGDSEVVFTDDASISNYAKDSIYKLYRTRKIAGVGNNRFAPKEIVTRAQAAKIIYDTLVSDN